MGYITLKVTNLLLRDKRSKREIPKWTKYAHQMLDSLNCTNGYCLYRH